MSDQPYPGGIQFDDFSKESGDNAHADAKVIEQEEQQSGKLSTALVLVGIEAYLTGT